MASPVHLILFRFPYPAACAANFQCSPVAPFRFFQPCFDFPFVPDIMENQDHAQHFSIVVENRRRAVFDGGFGAGSRPDLGMIRETHYDSFPHHVLDGILSRGARLLIEDNEDLAERPDRALLPWSSP